MDTVRRASVSSISSLEKTISAELPAALKPADTAPVVTPASPKRSDAPPASPTSQRRRSSNTGLFGNLMDHKRGSQDYAERRASHHDQGQSATLFGGWYNRTIRGVVPPAEKK